MMIDGSSLAFDENVELTREVVKYAHARGVSVEGELGVLAGVEDHVFSEGSTYTNPLKAVEFSGRQVWMLWPYPTEPCTGLPRERM